MLPSSSARPPFASLRRKSRIAPALAEVGLFEAGAEDVAVAGRGPAWDALAGLDEEGAGAGRRGVLDPPPQQRQLAAAPPPALERRRDPELGHLVVEQHRRAALRLAVDERQVAAPGGQAGEGDEERGGPGGEAETECRDRPEGGVGVGGVERDHLDVGGDLEAGRMAVADETHPVDAALEA